MKKFYAKFIKSKKDVRKLAKRIMKSYCKFHDIPENQKDAIEYSIAIKNKNLFNLVFNITNPFEKRLTFVIPRNSIVIFMKGECSIVPFILKNPNEVNTIKLDDYIKNKFDDVSAGEPSLETIERILYSSRKFLLIPNNEIPDSELIDTLPVTKQLILSHIVDLLFTLPETNKRIIWSDFTLISSEIVDNKDDNYTLNLHLSYGAEFINIKGVDMNLIINFNTKANGSLDTLSLVFQIDGNTFYINRPGDIFPIVDCIYEKYQIFYKNRKYALSKSFDKKEKGMIATLRKNKHLFVKVGEVFKLLRTPNERYIMIEKSNWYSGEYLEIRNCDALDIFNIIRLDNPNIDDTTRSVLDLMSENTNLFEYFLRIFFSKDYIMPNFDDIDGYMMLKLK